MALSAGVAGEMMGVLLRRMSRSRLVSWIPWYSGFWAACGTDCSFPGGVMTQ